MAAHCRPPAWWCGGCQLLLVAAATVKSNIAAEEQGEAVSHGCSLGKLN
jgi:hypothetical protein